MKTLVRIFISLLCVGITFGVALAQDAIWDMSIEDLLELKIDVVSKQEESLRTSPGIVSVLTAHDIEGLGVHSVAEAIGFMPGILAYDSYYTQYNQFAIRGNVGEEHYNSKILFLVNGHPVFNPLTGSFEVNAIPIGAIERIELIRGPVSVLYGTNALSGVISITTRKKLPKDTIEASYQYGTFSTHEGRFSTGQTIGNFRYFFSGTFKDQDGYDLMVKPQQDIAGAGFEQKQYADMASVFLNMAYKDITIDISGSRSQNPSKYGVIPSSAMLKMPGWEQDYLYVDSRYSKELGVKAILHAIFRYDYCSAKSRLNDFWAIDEAYYGWTGGPYSYAIHDQGGEKAGGEIYANVFLTKGLDMTTGISYDKYFDTEFKIYNPGGLSGISIYGEKENADAAFYCNLNYRPWKSLKMTGGLRYTDNDMTGGHWDYRCGAVFEIEESMVVKALYGTSYRSPSLFELNVDGPPLTVGDRDLKVETLDGLDISINYYWQDKLTASLTYFWNKTDDFITKVSTDQGSQYVNSEGNEIQGLEYEFKWFPLPDLNLFLNGTYVFDSEDTDSGNELDIMETLLSFGWTLSLLGNSLKISNANRYCNDWDKSGEFIVSNVALHYVPPVAEKFLDFFLTFNNLFDEEYEYAAVAASSIDTIPGGPPRSITAGIKVRW